MLYLYLGTGWYTELLSGLAYFLERMLIIVNNMNRVKGKKFINGHPTLPTFLQHHLLFPRWFDPFGLAEDA